jgi:cytochrome c-type biogenesis protein CcmF
LSAWNLTVIGATVATAVALGLYGSVPGQSGRIRTARVRGARGAFLVSFAFLALASAALVAALLRHDFSLTYVYSYSSRDLPTVYLISAFWAGQEGTFLLWALFGAAVGTILMFTSRDHEPSVMSFFSAVQIALLVFLLKASPFQLMRVVRTDGAGLNPLLQNPWMAIHPPIVFVGYALSAAPFAWAMSALWNDDYTTWVRPGLAWTLGAWLFLGAGILIGAKWAYSVLGWGGYWGWDPVENASLVPWLSGMALLHTLLMQLRRGRMLRTNIALAIVTLLLIIYGTFLTRSGVLSDFSVHSFSALGINAYLVGALAIITIASAGLFIYRLPSMARARGYSEPYDSMVSRDFAVFATALLFVGSAAVILLGTSAPLLTKFTGNPSAVGTSFYNITNAPFGFLLAMLMGICPFLAWRSSDSRHMGCLLAIPVAAAVVLTIVALAMGARGIWFLAFLFAAFLSLAANILMVARAARSGLLRIGGYITHVGVALIFIGIIATSAYDDTVRLSLTMGSPKPVFGYEMTYTGAELEEDGGVRLALDVALGDKMFRAAPYIQTTRRGPVRRPYIHSALYEDLYIAPLEAFSSGPETRSKTEGSVSVTLSKGQSATAAGLTVRFIRFDMSQHAESQMAVGAQLEVVTSDGKILGTATPVLALTRSGKSHQDAVLATPVGPVAFHLEAIDATNGTATVQIVRMVGEVEGQTGKRDRQVTGTPDGENQSPAAAAAPQAVLVEVSRKPLANSLWVGSILLLAGTTLAVIRRARGID